MKMKNTKSKNIISVITLTIILATTALISGITFVTAQRPVVEINTYAFVMVAPNPTGVGQGVQITLQIDKVSPTASGVEGGDHLEGLTATITKPDGTTETKGPYRAWAISGAFFYYTPNQVGTYTIQMNYPGQWINVTGNSGYEANTDYWFKPSTSAPAELIVQEDPIPGYPNDVMPITEYWQRPINSENKGWFEAADSWLMEGYAYEGRGPHSNTAFAPLTAAPNSAHILWRRPLWYGGIVGGQFGDASFYTGLAYEQPYEPLIVAGRIIYQEHTPSVSSREGTRCLDLYTGEEIWYLEGVSIAFAQIYMINNPNEHGGIAHLWARSGGSSNTTYTIYDAFTGVYQFTITNASRGTLKTGPNGEILSYRKTGSSLTFWNSSKAIFEAYPWQGFEPGGIYNPARNGIVDGSKGIEWTVPATEPGGIQVLNLEAGLLVVSSEDDSEYPFVWSQAGYSLEDGRLLWTQERRNIFGQHGYILRDSDAIRDGVWVQLDQAEMQFHGYSAATGEELWQTPPLPGGFAFWSRNFEIAYNKLYVATYDGYVRAYSLDDGTLLWENYAGNSGFETAYGSWPAYAGPTVADNKYFISNDEHSPDAVMWRGGKLRAIDVETGEDIWGISGMFRIPAISDGILTAANSHDGQIYAFGKGPSKTTVTTPDVGVTQGDSVMIKGTVTDQSPGSKDTPAISDEDMGDWMEYLYMQKQFPAQAKGVDVSLDVIDSNGNFRNIGTATTDASGTFGLLWAPDIPGQYTVLATFAGSESYGSSYAQSYLGVVDAPEPTPEPTPTPAPATDTYILGLGIAALIAIVVMGLLILMKLGKK